MTTISKRSFTAQLNKHVKNSYVKECILEKFNELLDRKFLLIVCIKSSLQYALVDVIGSDKEYRNEESLVDQVNKVADHFSLNINW